VGVACLSSDRRGGPEVGPSRRLLVLVDQSNEDVDGSAAEQRPLAESASPAPSAQPGALTHGSGTAGPDTGPAGSGGEEDAWVEDPGRVEGGLGRGQGQPERPRPLALVPGPVLAADPVVVGDGAPAASTASAAAAFTSTHCDSSPPRRAGASTVK
jgi:hypothetical protein